MDDVICRICGKSINPSIREEHEKEHQFLYQKGEEMSIASAVLGGKIGLEPGEKYLGRVRIIERLYDERYGKWYKIIFLDLPEGLELPPEIKEGLEIKESDLRLYSRLFEAGEKGRKRVEGMFKK